jgi:hypothetical protein
VGPSELVGGDHRLPAALLAARLGRLQPGVRAFADQVALELRQRAEDVENERPARRRGSRSGSRLLWSPARAPCRSGAPSSGRAGRASTPPVHRRGAGRRARRPSPAARPWRPTRGPGTPSRSRRLPARRAAAPGSARRWRLLHTRSAPRFSPRPLSRPAIIASVLPLSTDVAGQTWPWPPDLRLPDGACRRFAPTKLDRLRPTLSLA